MINFVVTYVNGSDKEWLKSYNRYSKVPVDECRFRDWNLLKYWFRSVAKNAPWVGDLFLVLSGPSQKPEWLSDEVNVVYHSDFIPEEYLPTFNSNAIEMFLNKIPGIGERIVYFNDDYYINNPIKPERLFQGSYPVDKPIYRDGFGTLYSGDYPHILMNNAQLMYELFPRKQRNIVPNHVPTPLYVPMMDKLMRNKIAKHYRDITASNKFRSRFDINQWVFREYQFYEHHFYNNYDNSDEAFINLTYDRLNSALELINNKDINLLCINDCQGIKDDEFKLLRDSLIKEFDIKYPEKCKYEI